MFEALKPLHILYLVFMYLLHSVEYYAGTVQGLDEIDQIEALLSVDINRDGSVGTPPADQSTDTAAPSTPPVYNRGKRVTPTPAATSGG